MTRKLLPFHPSVNKQCMLSLIHNFPKAEFNSEAFRKINNALIQQRCTPENTLFASSVCVDEINHTVTSLNDRLADYWKQCFYMGGLGGIPFSGRTGYKAYTHHMPDDGNVFILFASHVGISPDGEVGKFARHGKHQLSNACGASIGAFDLLSSCAIHKGHKIEFDEAKLMAGDDPFDSQFHFIKDAMKSRYADIVKHPNP